MTSWRVERKGRPSARWRVLYDGEDEERARAVYARERERMRQGMLVLLHDGHVENREGAPMLRTRW